MTNYKDQLLKIVKEKSLKFGEFDLAYGGKSNYYIDGKMTVTTPQGAYLIAKIILDKIAPYEINAIGGLEVGAIPIAMAVTTLCGIEKKDISSFFVRKEPKTRGTKKWIEGVLGKNDRIIIVDDVITTGTSVLKAIQKILEEVPDCKIVKVITLVDRLMGGTENIEKEGYQYEPIFTIKDLGVSNG